MTNDTTSDVIVQGPRQRSAQWGDLMTALAKAQGEIEGAKKDSEAVVTGTTKRKYADLASVWAAIRVPLTKNGLAIMQWPRVVANGVEIETIVAHGEQFISDILWMPCAQMNAHGIGSAITYGRRYALMAVAGVAPEDDDGESAMDRSGVVGSAGGGRDFRPPGPRRQSSWGDGGKQGVIEDAQRDGLTENAKAKPLPGAAAARTAAPINTPAAAGNAIKRIEWIKASITYLSDKDEHVARDWWIENKTRIEVIETALPTEYERLLDAYNEALERKVSA